MKWVLSGIFAFLLGIIIIQLFNNHKLKTEYEELKSELSNPIIERDTITRIDTITIEKPIPKYITRTNERVDTIIQYQTETDTLFIPLQFPIVSKEYSDDRYKALVKGVEFGSYPLLESLEIYQPTTTITETKTIVRKPKWGWSINLGAGYGYNPLTRRFEPNIGINLGYGFRL